MNAQLFQFIRDVRQSYWFVPSVMLIAAITLAFLTDRIDANYDTSFLAKIPWLYQSHPAGARAVLSAIATSMIGVAGVTFSMTIVSVSFAAANFGPRLIGNFMRDTGNQVTLGTFIATFVYCLSILRTITEPSESGDSGYVPHISLLVAQMLTFASVSVLIYFIHHIPESINVERITSMLGKSLLNSVETLFPRSLGVESNVGSGFEDDTEFDFDSASPFTSDSLGYLQSIDEENLIAVASRQDLTLRIEYRPGDFFTPGSTLLYHSSAAALDEDAKQDLIDCFAFGERRTPHQNVLFLINQMVEIQTRALSPGVNDPFTAISCMNWFLPSLKAVLEREITSPYRFDEAGQCRVIVNPITFVDIADAVFGKSLQYVSGDRNTSIAMFSLLAELVASSKRQQDKEVLLKHAQRLHDAANERLPVKSDRQAIDSRYLQLIKLANDPTYRHQQRDETDSLLGGRG